MAPLSKVLHLKHLVTFASILRSTPNSHCLVSIFLLCVFYLTFWSGHQGIRKREWLFWWVCFAFTRNGNWASFRANRPLIRCTCERWAAAAGEYHWTNVALTSTCLCLGLEAKYISHMRLRVHVYVTGCSRFAGFILSCKFLTLLLCIGRKIDMKEIFVFRYQSSVEFFPQEWFSKAERYIFKSLHSSFTEC